MSFGGREKKARNEIKKGARRSKKYTEQKLNQALDLSKPMGADIGGFAGASVDYSTGAPRASYNLPFADDNLFLANQGINSLLQGMNSGLAFDNPITQALSQLTKRDQMRAEEELTNNLNAMGQIGGSYDALRRQQLQEIFTDQSLKNRLAGFDATFQALQGLRNESISNQSQALSPIQIALQAASNNNAQRINRASFPMSAAGIQAPVMANTGSQLADIRLQTPTLMDNFLRWQQEQAKIAAVIAKTMAGGA